MCFAISARSVLTNDARCSRSFASGSTILAVQIGFILPSPSTQTYTSIVSTAFRNSSLRCICSMNGARISRYTSSKVSAAFAPGLIFDVAACAGWG